MAKYGEPTEQTAIVDAPAKLPADDYAPAPLLAPGAKVGRYVIVEPLGQGGMGVVYVADDPGLGRRVALKLLRPELIEEEGDSQGRERLVREAHAMAKLNHPNVVTIYDSGTYGDQVFLAVELVRGTTVKAWLSNRTRPWREILDVFLKAGRGLAAAHAAGIVHRDFKPENVLLGDDGAVKVIDFGLARAAGLGVHTRLDPDAIAAAARDTDDPLGTPLTRVGVISGTPAYMAPEQLVHGGGDALSDEFSFSVALYRALYDDLPFDKRLEGEARYRVKPPPRWTEVPEWVRRPVLRGLSLHAVDRYPTIEALLGALSSDPGVRRRRVAGFTGIAALVLAAAVISAAVILRGQAAADPCHEPESKLAGIWDDDARTQLRAAYAATGSPDAPGVAAYVEKRMDGASSAWVAGYRDACDATRMLQKQPEAALHLRLDCLDDKRRDLRANAEILMHPDAKTLRSCVGAASRLPVASDCADPATLEVVEQVSLEHRAEAEALRQELAHGRALVGASRYSDALDVLKALPDEAHKLEARALEVRALIAVGAAYSGLDGNDNFTKAIELHEKAEPLAEAARLDGQATTAAAEVAQLKSAVGRPRPEVDQWVDRARENLRRAGKNASAELDVEQAVGAVELLRGHNVEATKHRRRAMELAEQIWGSDAETTLTAESRLAAELDSVGEYEQELLLYRRAIAGLTSIFGARSQAPLVAQMNLAETLFDLGNLAEAQKTVDDVLDRLGEADRPEGAVVLAIQTT